MPETYAARQKRLAPQRAERERRHNELAGVAMQEQLGRIANALERVKVPRHPAEPRACQPPRIGGRPMLIRHGAALVVPERIRETYKDRIGGNGRNRRRATK